LERISLDRRKKGHLDGIRITFARAVKLGNCPEIYVPLCGTGFAARRLHGSVVAGCLCETVRMGGSLKSS